MSIAHRDELGIEPPILKIQVKAHEGNIGADLVKSFYAMIHDRDVGIFITTGGYTAAAHEFARSKANFRLIDGAEFVGLIEKYYDGLDTKFRKVIPLHRMLVPDCLFRTSAPENLTKKRPGNPGLSQLESDHQSSLDLIVRT